MTILEQISLCQRMAGSIKNDIQEGKTGNAIGKIELLEGELGIFRQDYENAEANENHEVADADFNEVSEASPAE